MRLKHVFSLCVSFAILYVLTIVGGGCAQIGSISGGDKDTLAPVLLGAAPKIAATNVTGNKITLTFDEYIEVKDLQNNLIVSPYPKTTPEVTFKLKTVSIKLKDSLVPNTTYSLQFGNSITDVNEGNPVKDFTYVFSTGNSIDSLKFSGKVVLAETGKVDSTIIVMLYRKAVDSTVKNRKPNYITTVKGDGSFVFNNLPAADFLVYALKDGDGGKTYNSKTEIFAFTDKVVTVSDTITSINLFAFEEEKKDKNLPTTTAKPKTAAQKKLRYTTKLTTEKQDLRENLKLEFSNKIMQIDSAQIILTDTNYNVIAASYSTDSNQLIIKTKWAEDFNYRLIINKNAVTDITDSSLSKTDTIKFKTKTKEDYGNVQIRFTNVDLTKKPVLQFVQNDLVKESFAITTDVWNYKLFPPGEYEIRILYDENNNGKWDPGSYTKKIQPEKVIAIPQKFAVKENWENESDIKL